MVRWMNAEYLELLPAQAHKLVRQIEAYTKFPIDVLPHPHSADPNDPNPQAPACTVSESSATIYVREGSTPQGIVHELLHIRRFLVDGVPRLFPAEDEALSPYASMIENALEHLVIVPLETSYGFEPYEHWNQTAMRNWSGYPWPHMTDPWTRQFNCLIGSLSARFLVTDGAVRRMVTDALEAEGLIPAATQLAKTVHAARSDKRRQVRTTLEQVGLPTAPFRLVQFDVRKGRQVIRSL